MGRPYDLAHDLDEQVRDIGTLGGVLAWSVNTLLSAIVVLVVGAIVVTVVDLAKRFQSVRTSSAT